VLYTVLTYGSSTMVNDNDKLKGCVVELDQPCPFAVPYLQSDLRFCQPCNPTSQPNSVSQGTGYLTLVSDKSAWPHVNPKLTIIVLYKRMFGSADIVPNIDGVVYSIC